MSNIWECRYSPSEMMYLEIKGSEVYLYLHHSPTRGDVYTFDQVLAGQIDAEVRNLFGNEVPDELKASIRDRIANPPLPPDEAKKRDMLRRRREG